MPTLTVAAQRVVLPGGRTPEPGWVDIRGGVIDAVGVGTPPRPPEVELADGWLVPAYVDIHCHGGGGGDFTSADPASIRRAATFHAAHGTGSLLASLVTAPIGTLCAQLAAIADVIEAGGTIVRGAHLEGPFLSAARCGAQNPAHLIAPDPAAFARLADAARGTLRMITIAPELPGAAELIRAARAAGVVVALGHTDASYDQCLTAYDAGASLATHLFNGMPPLHHREPGPVGASIDAHAWLELINDGVHLHPATVRAVLAARPDRAILITDAIVAAGLPDGAYQLGGLPVTLAAGQARLTESGSLAGSTLTMADAVRRLVTPRALGGVSVARVVAAAAEHPSNALGLHDRGAIEVGCAADLLHLRPDLTIAGIGR